MRDDQVNAPGEVSVMVREPFIWMAAAIMLTCAIMLVLGVGATGLWIAVITVGIAIVAIDGYLDSHGQHHV